LFMEFCIAANPIYFFATTNFTNENIRLLKKYFLNKL